MANRTKWTPQAKGKFLNKLRETANVSGSAKYAGLSRSIVYAKKESNKKFAKEWDDAIEESIDNLEAEARRRAFNGVNEPVFYKGKKVAVIKRYSDQLMQTLLAAHRPDKYRKNVNHSGEIKTPPALNVVINGDKS